MIRIAFRAVLVITLVVLAVGKTSGGRLPPSILVPFTYWFLFAGIFGILYVLYCAFQVWKDAPGRKLHARDLLIAIIWVIFWLLNLAR